MNFKKLAVLIIIPLMILNISGCNKSTKTSSSSSAASQKTSSTASTDSAYLGFSLPYTNVSALNPLLPASGVNEELSSLIYDSISEPDQSYSPVMRLASSVTSSGTTVKIVLKDGVRFSDGSSLTGDDVAYSLNFVKSRQDSPYYANLSNVNGISPDNSNTVTLSLNSPDPLIANLLNIPIIKQGSDTAGNAIGSGRYTFSKNGVNAVLTLNSKWYGGSTSAFSSIPLVNIPDQATINSCLEINEINYVYTDNGSGSTPSFVNTKAAQVNLNRLVYVGINTNKQHLNNAHFRRALSLSIDRKLLSSQTYSNRAEPAALPFNPAFKLLPKQSAKDIASDYNAVSSEMTLAGGTGGTGAAPLTILVNQENTVRVAVAKYIVGCFGKAGVNVSVKSVSFAQYQQLISQNNFDMYVGEIQLPDNMDISPLLAGGASSAFGAPSNSSTLTAFKSWQAGSSNFDSAVTAFNNEMPFIPLCYKIGTTSYTSGINNVTATNSDIFFNFEKWSHK